MPALKGRPTLTAASLRLAHARINEQRACQDRRSDKCVKGQGIRSRRRDGRGVAASGLHSMEAALAARGGGLSRLVLASAHHA
jgi:hypothetical protein